MDQRLDLQNKLETVLGSRNVYFQPPANVQLNYPCVVYDLSRLAHHDANNRPYALRPSFQYTYITRKASDLAKLSELASFKGSRHDRSFKADGLYHHVFTIQY